MVDGGTSWVEINNRIPWDERIGVFGLAVAISQPKENRYLNGGKG